MKNKPPKVNSAVQNSTDKGLRGLGPFILDKNVISMLVSWQVFFCPPTLFQGAPLIMWDMVKRVTKTRPRQGAHLAELRRAAGLSQYELARLVGVPQPNIAFWELSEKPPRSEVIPQMAQIPGDSRRADPQSGSGDGKKSGASGQGQENFRRSFLASPPATGEDRGICVGLSPAISAEQTELRKEGNHGYRRYQI
jgi:transcriptional regulator with XRE-family HTH domain